MARAIFVSLAVLYPQLDAKLGRERGSAALRNNTCAWWRINPTNAGDVRYAFGVWQGRVVSAYAVEVPVGHWPTMPGPAVGEGRRYIPASALSERDWARAATWSGIPMAGPLRYGEVQLDADGVLHGFDVPSEAEHPEEMDQEDSP